MCDACGGTAIVTDQKEGQMVCDDCGVIKRQSMISTNSEYRNFSESDKPTGARLIAAAPGAAAPWQLRCSCRRVAAPPRDRPPSCTLHWPLPHVQECSATRLFRPHTRAHMHIRTTHRRARLASLDVMRVAPSACRVTPDARPSASPMHVRPHKPSAWPHAARTPPYVHTAHASSAALQRAGRYAGDPTRVAAGPLGMNIAAVGGDMAAYGLKMKGAMLNSTSDRFRQANKQIADLVVKMGLPDEVKAKAQARRCTSLHASAHAPPAHASFGLVTACRSAWVARVMRASSAHGATPGMRATCCRC